MRTSLLAGLTLALAAGLSAGGASGAAHDRPDELRAALRGGGLVLYLRHPQASGSTQAAPRPPGCGGDARLTARGWQDALRIGSGLHRQGIAVEFALAGEDCPSRHAAYLIFGADRVRHLQGLAEACNREPGTRRRLGGALDGALATLPPFPDVNLAVVGHPCDLRELASADWPACAREPDAGAGVVFEPLGAGRWRLRGCLPAALLQSWGTGPRSN